MLRAAVPVGFCILVFLFALHAKTAVYGGVAQTKVTPSTASKLWVGGQKMQPGIVSPASAPLFLVVFLSLFLLGLQLVRQPRLQSSLILASPSNLRLRYLHRFLRPPPVRS